MKKIAILGSTGYIGKSIVTLLMQNKNISLYLFSRSENKIKDFVDQFGFAHANVEVCGNYNMFDEFSYDLIVNCAGIGNPMILKKDPSAIFEVTEYFDTLIINHLRKNNNTIYLNLSSGAVYGSSNIGPFSEKSKSCLCINELHQSEYYSIAKINSEAKHRALKNLNIVDLRIFSFFSSFVDIEAQFLLSDIVKALRNNTVFETSGVDIVRDFITPVDLVQVIEIILNEVRINNSFDMYSLAPVKKSELIDFFIRRFNLKTKIINDSFAISPTGTKNEYYPVSKKIEVLGYKPAHSSLSGIEAEMSKIVI